MTTVHRDNDIFCIDVKMLLALSFVPVDDVSAAFEYLVDSFPPDVAPLADYWEDNYICRERRGRYLNPRFNLQLWNVRDRVINNLPRINNSVEAWHRAFQQTSTDLLNILVRNKITSN